MNKPIIAIADNVDLKNLEFNDDNVVLLTTKGYKQLEIATFFGVSRQNISNRLIKLGLRHNEVKLSSMIAIKKNEIKQILDNESAELALLGKAARDRASELIKTEGQVVPCIAAMDRSFNQRRTLEGQPTEIIESREVLLSIQAKLERNRAELEGVDDDSKF